MQDSIAGRTRYLFHFSDGGSGMRVLDTVLDVGAEVTDGCSRYRVMRVEQPPNERALGFVWATLLDA
jgi:hypothetical protein